MFRKPTLSALGLILVLMANTPVFAGGGGGGKSPPVLDATPSVADVTTTTATLGGTVTAEGSLPLTDSGIEWGTVSAPAVGTHPNQVSGGGTGGLPFTFTVPVTGLPANTTIYFRAWAINGDNRTGYSDEITFNTLSAAGPPTLDASTLSALVDVTSSEATLGGNITGNGGSTITSRGTVWNTTGTPDIVTDAARALQESTSPTIEAFSHLRSGLNSGTLIYFRSYATNVNDTGYGPQNTFYTEPAASPLSATIDNVGDVSFRINWPANPAGDGDGAIVVINKDTAPVFTPTDGTEHPASATWADTGEQVVYRGTGATNVTVNGLAASTTYHVAVFYSAGSGGGETGINYRQSSPATASQQTNTPAVAPTVTVATPTPVTANECVMGGDVTDNGGASVTDRGIVWNITNVWDTGQPPASNGTPVAMGSGDGPFSQTVNGLPAGSTIYVRAYAINSAGTAYSLATEQCLTPAGLATVATRAVENITATTADLGGNVTDNGGATVTERGIVWNTTNVWDDLQPPASNGTAVPIGSGTGLFIETVGDDEAALPTGTPVYFKAYATNSAGTAYSGVQSFTPAGPPIVTATPAANEIHNAADLGGNVTSDGGSPVVDRGIVWRLDNNWDTAQPPASNGTVVPMGSGTGSFSQFVTGFPNFTQIHFRAYATNSEATGYSAEDTFTTLSEPTLQATNVVFTRTSGKSLQFEWTRGNGDGSIVLMREGAAVDQDPLYIPADFNDTYLDNPDFTIGQDLGCTTDCPPNPGNIVVYHGPNNTAWITGLDLGTTYHVAVYEYAGSGSKIDYIQDTPAENSAPTGSIPVHNYDNRVNCDDCHNQHGTFDFTDGTSMKAACTTCHNDSSPYAPNKVMFDNHTAPNRNPDIDEVSCGMCHEVHLDAVTKSNTQGTNPTTSQTQTNKSFLRTDVTKYVPNAAATAFLHTDQPKREEGNANNDPVQAAVTPERALEGDDVNTGKGYCQVCHTMTAYHRNDPALGNTTASDYGKAGLMQCHDGGSENIACAEEVNCGDCHEHNNSFVGVNNNLPCQDCHGELAPADPWASKLSIIRQFDLANALSSHIPNGTPTEPDCKVCHGQHGHGGTVFGFDADDGTTSWGTAADDTLQTGAGEVFTPHCMSCHDDSVASSLPTDGGPPTAGQTQNSPFINADAPPSIGDWANAGHNRPTSGNPVMSVPPNSPNPVSCIGDGTNGCHASGHGTQSDSLLAAWQGGSGDPATNTAESSAQFCYNCHDSNGPSSFNIEAQFTTLTNFQTVANGGKGALVNQRHDISTEDQTYSGAILGCADCHAPHQDNSTNPVSNPDTGAALSPYNFANYNAGGDADPSFGSGEPDYIPFCLACHDNAPPAGVTMSAGLVDIAASYVSNDHHGAVQGGGSGNGYLKSPYDGTDNVTYASMNCTTCHGAHGSENIFNLRTRININGTQMSVGGWTGDTIGTAGGADPTTYTLPLAVDTDGDKAADAQGDHNWGAWCSFCHQMQSHGRGELDTCTSGHMHGAGKM